MWQYTGIPAISPHSGSRYPPLYAISVSNARTKCQTRSSHKFIPSWECLSLPPNIHLLPGVPPLPKISGSFQKHLFSPRNSRLSPKYPSSPRSPRPLPKISGSFQKHLSSPRNSRFLSKIPIPSQKHHLPVKISFTSRKYLSFPGRLSPRNPRLFAEISSSPHPIKLPWECPGTALSSAGQCFSYISLISRKFPFSEGLRLSSSRFHWQ